MKTTLNGLWREPTLNGINATLHWRNAKKGAFKIASDVCKLCPGLVNGKTATYGQKHPVLLNKSGQKMVLCDLAKDLCVSQHL